MPQLLVRNLNQATIRKLKKHAEENQRSLQGEAKAILESAADRMTMAEFARASRRWHSYFKGRRLSDSAELIREGRDR